jgi:tetrahydromethanopterin S-methyltransferase subunit G
MKPSETKRILELLTQLTEAVIGPAARRPPTEPKPSLSERVDKLDTRVSEVQLGLATLAVNTKAGFDRVNERFEAVDKRFDGVDKRFDGVDKRFEAVNQRFDAADKRFDGVDKRLNDVDRNIDTTRVQLVDLVTRVHDEVTGRVVDLEPRGPAGRGGGRNSGGSGVPLAS